MPHVDGHHRQPAFQYQYQQLWLGLEQVIVWTNDLSASDLTCYCYSIHLRSVAFYAPNSHIMIDCGWLVGCWLVTFVTYVWLNNAS